MSDLSKTHLPMTNQKLQKVNFEFEEIKAERDALKAELFEAQQALLKEGMRADALQARIDNGIRVHVGKSRIFRFEINAIGPIKERRNSNAILIIDEGIEL